MRRFGFFGILLTFLALLGGPGCVSWNAADGTKHTVVIGFGIISQKEAPDHSATALRCQTVGLAVRTGTLNGGLALGYQHYQQTAIGPEWQGVVQVSSNPGEPLIVNGLGDTPKGLITSQTIEENNRCLSEFAKELASLP